jgi:hypothetical protein
MGDKECGGFVEVQKTSWQLRPETIYATVLYKAVMGDNFNSWLMFSERVNRRSTCTMGSMPATEIG